MSAVGYSITIPRQTDPPRLAHMRCSPEWSELLRTYHESCHFAYTTYLLLQSIADTTTGDVHVKWQRLADAQFEVWVDVESAAAPLLHAEERN